MRPELDSENSAGTNKLLGSARGRAVTKSVAGSPHSKGFRRSLPVVSKSVAFNYIRLSAAGMPMLRRSAFFATLVTREIRGGGGGVWGGGGVFPSLGGRGGGRRGGCLSWLRPG